MVTYKPRSVKRPRRTKLEIASYRDALLEIVEQVQPCTARQVYYVGVGSLHDKGQSQYKSVIRELGILREDGRLPWEWIQDNTRLCRHDPGFDSVEEALAHAAEKFRRNLWSAQPRRVEVWCESDSIGGVLNGVRRTLGVPMFACRGQSSKTFVHEAAMEHNRIGKPVTVLYAGDWDPTGLAVDRSAEERLARYGGGQVTTEFRRIAVTPDQIRDLNLVTHEVNTKDKNYSKFGVACEEAGLPADQAVEVEAIPPRMLRQLLTDSIYDLVEDASAWNSVIREEPQDLAFITEIAAGVR